MAAESLYSDGTIHYFVVDDQSSSEDVKLLEDLKMATEFEGVEQPGGAVQVGKVSQYHESKLNSQVTLEDLEDRVTVFIYEGNGLVVIGQDSPGNHVNLGAHFREVLEYDLGVPTQPTKLSSEITDDDLRNFVKIKSCTDSDDGQDYFTKGTVTVKDGDSTETNEDSCHDRALREYYCTGTASNYAQYLCPDDCKNGACVEADTCSNQVLDPGETDIDCGGNCPPCSGMECQTNSDCVPPSICKDGECEETQENVVCTDTDNGKNYYEKGTVKSEDIGSGTDYCSSNNVLMEFYCAGTSSSNTEAYTCPYGCENGVCKEEVKNDCSTNTDCDDDNACTTDICSGTPKTCSNSESLIGCNHGGNCLPIGTRINKNYCDIDKEMKSQLTESSECNNNYECSSNVCVNNKCISPSFIQKIIDWFTSLFGG